MSNIYELVKNFKSNNSLGIAWRLKAHSKVVEKHLNPGEEVLYAFAGQKNPGVFQWFDTYVVAITNKRLLLGHKNLLWGYVLSSITPDMYNDLQVYSGLLWGQIVIDTIKEEVVLTNLPTSSLNEIETKITDFMMEQKKLYAKKDEK